MGRHRLPDPSWATYPTGMVWYSFCSLTWRRQTGPAMWHTEIIARDEEVYALHGRRYPRA